MDRATWLQERRKGIGSSQAAAICGLSPWSSPLEAFIGYRTMDDREPTEPMAIGLEMEPVLAKLYEKRTGEPLRKPEPILWSKDHPFMLASLDFERVSDSRIVETKTTRNGDGFGEPGTDEVPQHYLIQVQHQMAVTGRDVADVAVLVGGNEFRIYTVHRNEELIASLVRILSDFWGLVVRNEPPAFDWSLRRTPELVKRLYSSVATGKRIELPQEADMWAAEWKRLAQEENFAKEAKEHAKARMQTLVGDAAVGVLPSGAEVHRKIVHRAGYVVPPSEYVDFRFKKPKHKALNHVFAVGYEAAE